MSFENLAFDVGGYDDDFLDNNHDQGRKTGKKNGIKGNDFSFNKTSNLRQSVDVEYEGYYLEKTEPARTGEKPNWTQVSQRKLPFNDSKLEEISRKQRLESRQNVEKAFENLSRDQQAVVTRLVDTRQVSERNTNAVWSLVCVRKYPAPVAKSFWTQTRPPTKKILVIIKREARTTARNKLGSAVRDTIAYRDTEIIDLADPLPIKPKKNGSLIGGFDVGPKNAFGFDRDFENNFGVAKGNNKTGKNKTKGMKKGPEIFHERHDSGADFGDNFGEPRDLGLNQEPFHDPFAGVSLGDTLPNDRIPVPPAQHGGPYGQPKNHQMHHQNVVPQGQWNQPLNSTPNMHQYQHNQQPGFGQPANGAIHVNDWPQQQGHRPQMYEPPRQGSMPYEGHPFQPQAHHNQPGGFDLPPTLLNEDPRWGGRGRDRRPPSNRRRSRSGRPDDPMFLEKVNGWKINDGHSSDESYRDEIWSSPRDSRYSFTPPSSPPRSDYLGDRVYPSGSLSRSRSHKYRSGERERGYPRDRSYERDILIKPHDSRRRHRSRGHDRYESPPRYIVESDYRRKRPIVIQRTLTDYPSQPAADFRERRPRYVEDDRIEYEISGRERRGGGRRSDYDRDERYYDDRGRRGGGRRMSMIG